ncbi:hypothetical protein F4604DRAFT_1797451 [Suillus subluteus]|nr:hypothetical protein F4604DRAFT_1797451 [Suillus subluteus]
MLAVQKICLLCPRLSCVVLHGVLVLKDPTREIKNAVTVDGIVSHFASRRTELASMSDDILFKSLLTASVPPACTRSRGTLLAAEFQNLYGLNLATTLLSHRKTCGALANHARERALHLFRAGASVLGDVYLTYFPFLSCYLLSDKAVFCQILAHEFGVLVTGRLSQEIVSCSVKDMSVLISVYAVAAMCSLHEESSPLSQRQKEDY